MLLGSEGTGRGVGVGVVADVVAGAGVSLGSGVGVEEVVTETVVIEPGTGAVEAGVVEAGAVEAGVVEAVVEAGVVEAGVVEAGAVEAGGVPVADDLDCGTRCAGTPPDCDCLSVLFLRLPPFAKTNPAPLPCCLTSLEDRGSRGRPVSDLRSETGGPPPPLGYC